MFAFKPGALPDIFQERCRVPCHCFPLIVSFIRFWQEAPPINDGVFKPWNPLCETSLDKFLVDSHDEESKARLRVMGNVVIPPQAVAAFSVLARVFPLNREH